MLLSSYLKKIPLFSNFNNDQLDLLYKAGLTKNYPKGSILVSQHGPGDTFYIVISGRVKVTLLHEDGNEIVLYILKEGDFFGELSLLDKEPRSASVISLTETSLFLITQGRFKQLVSSNSEILEKVLQCICKRLRDANETIKNFACLDAYERTLFVLQQLAQIQGTRKGNYIEIFHVPTHEEISKTVGVSRETISRIIQALKKDNKLISYTRRKIILKA